MPAFGFTFHGGEHIVTSAHYAILSLTQVFPGTSIRRFPRCTPVRLAFSRRSFTVVLTLIQSGVYVARDLRRQLRRARDMETHEVRKKALDRAVRMLYQPMRLEHIAAQEVRSSVTSERALRAATELCLPQSMMELITHDLDYMVDDQMYPDSLS